MLKVVIVEDEPLARVRLKQMLLKLDEVVEVQAELESVQEATQYFGAHPHPDLAFFDIQLGDGLSFHIFENTSVHCPVIFTTAFDEYSIRAFKVNSIDYLLKPFTLEDVQNAIDKYKSIYQENKPFINEDLIQQLLQKSTGSANYRKRIMLRIGDRIITLQTSNINYIYSLQKATYAHMKDGKEYLLDDSLDNLEPQLDPDLYFRLNRQYIIHIDAVKEIVAWTNSRLKIELHNCNNSEVFVSRNKAGAFKDWLDR